jgi:hypothetical protein
MKKSKFTEEQIAYALRQVEGGTAVLRKDSLRNPTDVICARDPNCVCPAH